MSMRLFLPALNNGVLPISYFHALARLGEEGLILIEPSQPFVSLGFFDKIEGIDEEFCKEQAIPIMRRETGGGTVLLGPGQIFYTLVIKRPNVVLRGSVSDAYQRLSSAIIAAYKALGIITSLRPINDIVTTKNRKISGQGAGDINGHFCFVGSILIDFDTDLMHRIVRLPNTILRAKLKETLKEQMSSIIKETGFRPSAEKVKKELIHAFTAVLGELTPAPVSAQFAQHANTVAGELMSTAILEQDDLPSSTLFKVREGLYLCQRQITCQNQDMLHVSLTIQDDIISAVDCTLTQKDNARSVPVFSNLIGLPFSHAAIATTLADLDTLGLTKMKILEAFFGPRF